MQPILRAFQTLVAIAALLVSGAAMAQDWSRNPSYGSISLSAGFLPDPHVRTLRAGGDNFRDLGVCRGYFPTSPDYRLHYRAGSFALNFYVRAGGDTILLVNAPNGQWYCNDDYSGLDPAVLFGSPQSGQYDIFVGTYNRSRVSGARLYITEYAPFSR